MHWSTKRTVHAQPTKVTRPFQLDLAISVRLPTSNEKKMSLGVISVTDSLCDADRTLRCFYQTWQAWTTKVFGVVRICCRCARAETKITGATITQVAHMVPHVSMCVAFDMVASRRKGK